MRLIDADKLEPILIPVAPLFPEDNIHYEWVYLKNEVDNQPTVEERPKAKWIMHIDDLFPEDSMQECSNCHEYQYLTCDDNYCPNCGAEMKGKEE